MPPAASGALAGGNASRRWCREHDTPGGCIHTNARDALLLPHHFGKPQYRNFGKLSEESESDTIKCSMSDSADPDLPPAGALHKMSF